MLTPRFLRTAKQDRALREAILHIIPDHYVGTMGMEYFYPVFGRIYWNRMNESIALATSYLDRGGPLLIGDIGCGFGILAAKLSRVFPGCKLVGIDLFPPEKLGWALRLCREWDADSNVEVINADAERMPIPSGVFDLVFALDSLEHTPDPVRAITEMGRVLKDEGMAIVCAPVEGRLFRMLRYVLLLGGKIGETSPHWRGAVSSLGDFVKELDRHLQIVTTRYYPLRWAGRVLNYDLLILCSRRPQNAQTMAEMDARTCSTCGSHRAV